jgi:hypothetical protein
MGEALAGIMGGAAAEAAPSIGLSAASAAAPTWGENALRTTAALSSSPILRGITSMQASNMAGERKAPFAGSGANLGNPQVTISALPALAPTKPLPFQIPPNFNRGAK